MLAIFSLFWYPIVDTHLQREGRDEEQRDDRGEAGEDHTGDAEYSVDAQRNDQRAVSERATGGE